MKRCSQCAREYDASMSFCLDDGSELLYGPASKSEQPALSAGVIGGSNAVGEPATALFKSPGFDNSPAAETAILQAPAAAESSHSPRTLRNSHSRFTMPLIALGVLVVVLIGSFFGYRYSVSTTAQIESIAVMPFLNESGNADYEYLSDGMTETLISSLSQLPNLDVKPRSSVFRYKGKETDAQTLGKELHVQAVLNGRVTQRGQDISLYVELVDIERNKTIWSETYNRKQSDLVTLQNDI